MAHLPKDFSPVTNGGDAAILFCFVLLYLAVAGGGMLRLGQASEGGPHPPAS
jgi:putative oxidoreductase